MSTRISAAGGVRPAPRWWRTFERGMIMIMIPATVACIQGWGFGNDIIVTRATLLVSVFGAALIKFIGMILVDPEDNYVSNLAQSDQNKIEELNTPPVKIENNNHNQPS